MKTKETASTLLLMAFVILIMMILASINQYQIGQLQSQARNTLDLVRAYHPEHPEAKQ